MKEPSPQIKFLLSDKKVVRDIAVAYDSLMLVFNQNQRDIVTEANMSNIGPAILAHGEIINVIDLFDAKGKEIIAAEARAEKSKTN